MTLVDNRPEAPPVAVPDVEGTVRLRHLVGARRGWLTVLAPAAGIDRPLAGATIWDPTRPAGRHQLLLLTAPRPTGAEIAEVLAEAARTDAAAVAVRGGCLPPEHDTAAPAKVPVLAVDDRVSWEELGTLVGSLVSAARFGERGGTPSTGGLYDLAESAALALDGAVVLTDAAMRVLAFACGDTVDDLTSETVLARRAPSALRDRLPPVRSRGAATWVDVADAGPRLVAPILVGDLIAGYAVLAPGWDTPDTAPRLLGDVAAAAAAWFLDEPTGSDDEDVIRAELLRGLLTGTGSLEALAERLGRPAAGPWHLLSLGVHGDGAAGGVVPDLERLLARCTRLLDPNTATAVLGSVAYVLLPHRSDPEPTRFADRLRQRVARPVGAPLVACLSQPLATRADVCTESRLLGQAVAVLAARARPATADLAELRPHLVIAELAGLATEHPQLLNGALDAFRGDDSPRNAEYRHTLLNWFDAGCDITRAAAALQVHRNTLRYRLRRIETLCAIDLDDPVQRFALELQVRLLVFHRKQ